jgi:hypothetical protein
MKNQGKSGAQKAAPNILMGIFRRGRRDLEGERRVLHGQPGRRYKVDGPSGSPQCLYHNMSASLIGDHQWYHAVCSRGLRLRRLI